MLLAAPTATSAGFALVAHTSAASVGGASCTTAPINTVGANLIIAHVQYYNPPGAAVLSDSQTSTWLTAITRTHSYTTAVTGFISYVQGGPTSATHTFTVTAPGGYASIEVAAFSGAATSPLDLFGGADNGSTAATTIAPGAITTTTAELIVTGAGSYSTTATTTIAPAGDGQTGYAILDARPYDGANNEGSVLAYLIQSAAGTTNPTWTRTVAGQCEALIASFKAAPSSGGGPISAPISSITYGTVFKYNSQYSAKYIAADVWTSTWADDDNIYTLSDDSYGWQDAAPTSNVATSLLSDYSTGLTGSLINPMAAWGTLGQGGSDGSDHTYKGQGLISVAGKLYATVSRHIYGNLSGTGTAAKQAAGNCQIITSTYGVTWTPAPPSTANPYASPMFPGSTFGAPFFVQYGKDYVGQTADNSANYIYMISNDGWWNNGSDLYLARCSLANLPNLSAADWSYYQGGDGMVSGNWGAKATAASILNNPLKLSMTAVQYLPAFSCYVMIQWWYLSIANGTLYDSTQTQWDVYQARHPWGPWSLLSSKLWNTPGNGSGLYNPCIIPKSLQADGGLTAMIACAGDHNSQNRATGDYTLTLIPITLAGSGLTPPPIPMNTLLPAVTGTASVGSTLTCSTGTWTNSPTSYAYQWKRDATTNIGTGVSTYVVVSADLGHALTCVVTATNAVGSATATSNSVAATATAWNPADKDGHITLSNANTTASNALAESSHWASVRSTGTTKTGSSGKVYFEATTGALSFASGQFIQIGFANAGASLTNYIGVDVNSVGLYAGTATASNIVVNNTNISASTCVLSGAGPYTIGVAIDFGAGLIWTTINGTSWNSGGGTPGAGTGGASFSGIVAAGPYMIFGGTAGDGTNPSSLTIKTSAAFTYSVPSGFSAWG